MASVRSKTTVPTGDSALLGWAQNASTKITATPTRYALTTAVATALASDVSVFAAALAVCEPNERSKTKVLAKNAAKKTLLAQCRDIVKLVEGAASVTDEERSEIGISPRKQRSPIPPPSEAPNIDIVSVVGRTVKIKVHGETSRRGRPEGVYGVQLYTFVGTTPPQDPMEWEFFGAATVTSFTVDFPISVAAGTQVWFKACWTNFRNQVGPESEAIPTYIQFSTTSRAA